MRALTSDAAPRVAIAHEWIGPKGGAEQVFASIAQCFPNADLFALSTDPRNTLELGGRELRTTFLNRVNQLTDKRHLLLPLMPLAWHFATRLPYEVVITSSHALVRYFRPARNALHLCYCHTPMRYAWLPEIDTRQRIRRPATRAAEAALRSLDRRTVAWVDSFAANSSETRNRIREFYGRDARVIHPPVDTTFFHLEPSIPRGDYVLAVSRFVPYKRLEVAIEVAADVNVPLVIAGSGPGERALRRWAHLRHPGHVQFEISPTPERLRLLYRRARVLIYPAIEDFGIVPVEAQSCGCPVVAVGRGGTLDTVIHGETGFLAANSSATAIAQAVERALSTGLSPAAIASNAEAFSVENFNEGILSWWEESTTRRLEAKSSSRR